MTFFGSWASLTIHMKISLVPGHFPIPNQTFPNSLPAIGNIFFNFQCSILPRPFPRVKYWLDNLPTLSHPGSPTLSILHHKMQRYSARKVRIIQNRMLSMTQVAKGFPYFPDDLAPGHSSSPAEHFDQLCNLLTMYKVVTVKFNSNRESLQAVS